MSDLIRRSDARDAINVSWGLFDARKRVESLPSADITATEECQKCQEATERVLLNARKPKPYTEGREDYELATEQMEHDAMYEPTYNPEDGSM